MEERFILRVWQDQAIGWRASLKNMVSKEVYFFTNFDLFSSFFAQARKSSIPPESSTDDQAAILNLAKELDEKLKISESVTIRRTDEGFELSSPKPSQSDELQLIGIAS